MAELDISTKNCIVEQEGKVLIVTLNRPEAKNAFSPEMLLGLYKAWRRLDEDDSLMCAILTANGDTFCAGMDLKAGADGDQRATGEFMVKYNLMEQVGQKPKGGVAVKQAFFTKKPDALYAIIPGWPGKQFVLRDVRVPPGAKVTMLGVSNALGHKVEGNDLIVTLPDLGPEEAPSRHTARTNHSRQRPRRATCRPKK